jgi:hypothetical protein
MAGICELGKLIKGFQTYVYMDHKNNLFTEAQLGNRRRIKQMSNWALELQQFNIVRVWIRGEANILADAPSRAPWEAEMARHLPIPDMPLRELIKQMYVSPESWAALVASKAEKLNLAEWQTLERQYHPETFPDVEETMAKHDNDRKELAEGAGEKSVRGQKISSTSSGHATFGHATPPTLGLRTV